MDKQLYGVAGKDKETPNGFSHASDAVHDGMKPRQPDIAGFVATMTALRGGPTHERDCSLSGSGTPCRIPQFLVGERQRRLYPLEPHAVDYIEADHNYVTFWADGKEYISRDSIKRLAGLLAEFGFIRIERSLLINVRAIAYAQPVERRSFAFTLTSGVCLQSSASYRESILTVLPLAPLSSR